MSHVVGGVSGAIFGGIVRQLVLQVADNHHAFHEDAKPGELALQLGTRRFNSSKKFRTRTNLLVSSSSPS